jgi:hypothetical protein
MIQLPVDNPSIEQPWRDLIRAMTSPELLLSTIDSRRGELSPSQAIDLCYKAAILEQVIRLRWDSKFRISLPQRYRNTFKPEGELWHRVLTLVQEVHLLHPSGYSHPAVWFALALDEGVLGGINHGRGKDYDIRVIQQQNKALQSLSNPFDRAKYPHTWALIEKAGEVAEQLDRFRASIYRPMLAARSALAQELRLPQRLALIQKQGELHLQSGRGKRSRKLPGVPVGATM